MIGLKSATMLGTIQYSLLLMAIIICLLCNHCPPTFSFGTLWKELSDNRTWWVYTLSRHRAEKYDFFATSLVIKGFYKANKSSSFEQSY